MLANYIMRYIIGISGKAGTGKDFVAHNIISPLLTPRVNKIYLSFADVFKLDVIVRDKIARDRIYGQKDTESRDMLQKRGTEQGRNVFGPDIWVHYMEQTILNHEERGITHFYITDVRFPNEMEWIRSQGGVVIRINAPQRNLTKLQKETSGNEEEIKRLVSHPSETVLDNAKFDFTFDNDPGYSIFTEVQNSIPDIVEKLKDVGGTIHFLTNPYSTLTPGNTVIVCDKEIPDSVVKLKMKYPQLIISQSDDPFFDYPCNTYILSDESLITQCTKQISGLVVIKKFRS